MLNLADAPRETVMRLNLSRRTGVYFIRNRINEKLYIGSAARNFSFRFRCHANTLKYGTHPNRHLQGAWGQYGPKAFEWGVIEDCSPEECIKCEQKWIDFFKPEYNFCLIAGSSLGTKLSEEAKMKWKKANVGRKMSPERIEQHRIAMTGRKHSEETRAKISASSRRLKMSEAHKQKLRIINTGRIISDETRQKMSLSQMGITRNLGKKASDATKAKMRMSQLGRKHTLETRLKMSASMTGLKRTEEGRKNISLAKIGKRLSPEIIAIRTEKRRKTFALKKERALCV